MNTDAAAHNKQSQSSMFKCSQSVEQKLKNALDGVTFVASRESLVTFLQVTLLPYVHSTGLVIITRAGTDFFHWREIATPAQQILSQEFLFFQFSFFFKVAVTIHNLVRL